MQSRSITFLIAALVSIVTCSNTSNAQAESKRQSSAAAVRSDIIPASSLPKEDLYNRALVLYRKGQYPKAAPLYRKACDGGNGSACTNLGYMYERGLGVDKDERSAATLYRRGCDANDAQGCTNLALLYFQGRGVESDQHRAAELDQRGCAGGSASGCANLGTIYWKGSGVPKNEELGARFMQQGCDGGNAQACRFLGFFYETGQGVPRSESRALELYEQACDDDEAAACTNAGLIQSNACSTGAKRKHRARFLPPSLPRRRCTRLRKTWLDVRARPGRPCRPRPRRRVLPTGM